MITAKALLLEALLTLDDIESANHALGRVEHRLKALVLQLKMLELEQKAGTTVTVSGKYPFDHKLEDPPPIKGVPDGD
jgi:hypothetical protein